MTPVEIGGTVPGPRDFGIVTALPSAASIGDFCTFKVEVGVYWRLQYTGEATYPWTKIGGSPLVSQYIGTGEQTLSTSSETKQSTNAPSITLPALAIEADVKWGAGAAGVTNGSQARLFLAIATVTSEKFNRWCAALTTAAGQGGSINQRYRGVFTSGQVLAAYYARVAGAGEVTFYGAYIEVDPIRVG